MTFSDRKVAEFVNANFVATWFNRGEGFHNEDYSTENWIFRSSMEAYPTKNICTFFLNPEGQVFHYLAGSWAPEIFRVELEAALRLRREAFDDRMRLKPGGLAALSRVHEDLATRIRPEVSGMSFAAWSYRGARHEHTEACRRAAESGARYLASVHRFWSLARELPGLEEVRYDYLYGNSFTEEPREGGSQIQGKEATE